MTVNRGKDFENNIRKQFEELGDAFVLRLYDITMGYKQIDNPCDLIVFRHETLNLFECKAIHGNCLNFKSHIRPNQWEKLLKYSKLGGINAGILVWFIDSDETYFIDIYWLNELLKKGNKSYNVNKDFNELFVYPVYGIKKRVFFEYDLDKLLKEIEYA